MSLMTLKSLNSLCRVDIKVPNDLNDLKVFKATEHNTSPHSE